MRRDMMTVKMGAELFTVSANDTATFFRLTNPSTTVVNLTAHKNNEPVAPENQVPPLSDGRPEAQPAAVLLLLLVLFMHITSATFSF